VISEAVRLVVTLGFTAVGFLIGRGLPDWAESSDLDSDVTIVLGAVIGAGVGYVLGGLLGRLVRRGLERAPDLVAKATGPQLFAGTFGLLAGMIVGVVVSVPLIAFLPGAVGWPIAALIVMLLAAFGGKVFASRSGDLLAAAGLRPKEPLRVRPDLPGASSFVVDSSAAIDGRILELARAALVAGQVWVPAFVLDELQGIADSGSKSRRRRGRRGLDVLEALRDIPNIDLKVTDETVPEHEEVDAKLLALVARTEATLVSTDHNLTKAASLRGIRVLNPHAVGESLRPAVVPGDRVELLVEREGTEPGQGVGFLDDGTMVVIEGGAAFVGDTVSVEVANAVRTSIGRMLFSRVES
jgi:uncharacterized protein YacL